MKRDKGLSINKLIMDNRLYFENFRQLETLNSGFVCSVYSLNLDIGIIFYCTLQRLSVFHLYVLYSPCSTYT
jgi:hypothetical protein